jgi:hypothetical protein
MQSEEPAPDSATVPKWLKEAIYLISVGTEHGVLTTDYLSEPGSLGPFNSKMFLGNHHRV